MAQYLSGTVTHNIKKSYYYIITSRIKYIARKKKEYIQKKPVITIVIKIGNKHSSNVAIFEAFFNFKFFCRRRRY